MLVHPTLRRVSRGSQPFAMTQADFERAIDILDGIGRSGHHRVAGIPDLLIALYLELSVTQDDPLTIFNPKSNTTKK